MSTTKQTHKTKENKIMKKGTLIALYIILALTLLGEGISIVQHFTKGLPIDWAGFGVVCAALTCAFACVETKSKKNVEEK